MYVIYHYTCLHINKYIVYNLYVIYKWEQSVYRREKEFYIYKTS